MSFIEGIGDDFLYAFIFLIFIGIVCLAWLSTHVNNVHLPTTLFIIERRTHRTNEEGSERASPAPSPSINSQNEQLTSPSSANETLTEHESDIESSEVDEFLSEQTPISTQSNPINLNESTSIEGEDQSLRITIKFLNETQKSIIANSNDTIYKVKRLYFADELASNKIVRFIYQGRELQDPQTLRTYNIRDQTIIHCQISTRRHSTPNRINDGITTTHGFDTSSFLDASPITISSHFILFIALILGSVWYLRIKFRVLFTPISTIILILITIIFLIFTCGPVLTTRRQISDTRIPTQIQHVHVE
ncbi:unnamed protein product [Adineta steineri]|uniref:Ubiquitin-like domain-containing protein n=1 Tax=Adineta steineri TaxID=433720 RepID=A0A819DA96_9BILA|nr:unnamed protein product [Adineta steineri]CAF3831241.1 unnamed protein product [Adineta steineri]